MTVYALFWSASLLSALGIRRRVATTTFLFVMFLFIGLRLDTGFDWPVYKRIYQDFEQEFTLFRLVLYSEFYGQEPGFLFVLGLASQYFPSYEAFQALVTIGLLWSTALLSRTYGVREVALVVAIVMTYLLWSVGFSTLRQSMAISFVNFGLVCFHHRKPTWGWALFVLGTMFQFSSVVYIAAFALARYAWRTPKPPALSTFLIATLIAGIMAPLAITLISLASGFAAQKLQFYLELSGTPKFGPNDVVFLMFFAASALMVSRGMVKPGIDPPYVNELRRLIMVLAAIGASSTFFAVLRDRVSYELFILVSVYVMMPGLRYRWYFVGFFVSFGILNSVINTFPFPLQLAFSPYQNVIVSYVLDQDSTGPDRSAAFFQAFIEMNALLRR